MHSQVMSRIYCLFKMQLDKKEKRKFVGRVYFRETYTFMELHVQLLLGDVIRKERDQGQSLQ